MVAYTVDYRLFVYKKAGAEQYDIGSQIAADGGYYEVCDSGRWYAEYSYP